MPNFAAMTRAGAVGRAVSAVRIRPQHPHQNNPVMPAQAGIQACTRNEAQWSPLWIPAFAGMTRVRTGAVGRAVSAVRIRPQHPQHPHQNNPVMPAQAGIQACTRDVPRRPPLWIPAFAGMTGNGAASHTPTPFMPAFAGMTGNGAASHTPTLGMPAFAGMTRVRTGAVGRAVPASRLGLPHRHPHPHQNNPVMPAQAGIQKPIGAPA